MLADGLGKASARAASVKEKREAESEMKVPKVYSAGGSRDVCNRKAIKRAPVAKKEAVDSMKI